VILQAIDHQKNNTTKQKIMKPSKILHAFLLGSVFVATSQLHAANVLLLSDNFNTADNTDLNQNLGTRQAGTLEGAGSDWSENVNPNSAISSDQLNVSDGSQVWNNADFEADLTSINLSAVSGFVMDFKMDYTGNAGAWTSPYLSTHNAADERGNSRFGMVAFGNGNVQFYGGAVGGSQVGTDLSNATLAGLVSGWDITNLNSYSLVATRLTATTGVYDAFINGVEVASNIAYAFDAGGTNGEVNFEIINVSSGAGLYDDFSITTIPEPSAALLGGLGMLALLRRRRN
jgi:hypothetical protein